MFRKLTIWHIRKRIGYYKYQTLSIINELEYSNENLGKYKIACLSIELEIYERNISNLDAAIKCL